MVRRKSINPCGLLTHHVNKAMLTAELKRGLRKRPPKSVKSVNGWNRFVPRIISTNPQTVNRQTDTGPIHREFVGYFMPAYQECEVENRQAVSSAIEPGGINRRLSGMHGAGGCGDYLQLYSHGAEIRGRKYRKLLNTSKAILEPSMKGSK